MARDALQAWNEWGDVCAIERCSVAARAELDAFGDRSLRAGIKKLPEDVRNTLWLEPAYEPKRAGKFKLAGKPGAIPPDEAGEESGMNGWNDTEDADDMEDDAPLPVSRSRRPLAGYGFALLETHSLGHVYRSGKADPELMGKTYKAGLFHKAKQAGQGALKALEGQACLMIRTAARQRWIEEAPPPMTTSLDAPVSSSADETRKLLDIIPTPIDLDDPASRELLAIAEREAPAIFAAMPFVQRVVVLAVHLGLPYSNSPAVMAVTGKVASSLGDQYKYVYKRRDYLARLKEKFPGEDPETMDILHQMVLTVCGDLAFEWGRSEKSCAPLF